MNAIDKSKLLTDPCVTDCGSYEVDVLTRAKEIVDRTIIEALEEIRKRYDCAVGENCPGCEKKEDLPGYGLTDWPTAEKMSARDGLRCVRNMMKKWKNERGMGEWKFFAEFIGLDSDGSSDFYNYQVRWSVPTVAYPEPQVTVSVFFTVQARRMENTNCPVDVTYVFEGNQFAHNPKMPFRPKWIYDVLDTKTMIFKSIAF